ncbi:MAG: ankyrin repeat domain-containing protein [Sphaerochaetaceae bacterium]|jgi:ankyrin repeat protein
MTTERELLMRAVLAGDTKETFRMLESGTKTDDPDEKGRTPLLTGLSLGSPLATIEDLIRHGANVNAHDDDGITPLMAAVSSPVRQRAAIRYLLRSGADPNATDKQGMTALHKVIHTGDATLLCEKGADINTLDGKGQSPLAEAIVRECDSLLAKEFLENGADKYRKGGDGMDAREALVRICHDPLLFALLLEESDYRRCDEKGYTLLMQAAAHNRHSEVVTSMLEHGAPVNAAALDGTTALMMAAMANPTTTVLKTLIEHGADVNAKNNRGVTAVMMASIDPFRTDKIDLLVRSGADINAQDAAGMTALMHAFTAYIREENIKTLLSLGADTTIQDKRGRDVRFYAATKEGKELLAM